MSTILDLVDKRLKKFRRELLDELEEFETGHIRELFVTPEKAQKKTEETAALKSAIENAYTLYPKKMGKSNGIKRLMRGQHKISLEEVPLLEESIRKYTEQVDAHGTDKQYIKHFDTFVSCWRDFLECPESHKLEW